MEILKKRVGNDLVMRLTISDSGIALDWSDVTVISAHMYSDGARITAGRCRWSLDPDDHTILVVTYGPDEPQYLGYNRLVLSCEYRGHTATYDQVVVNYVPLTEMEGTETVADVAVSLSTGEMTEGIAIAVESISSSVIGQLIDDMQEAMEQAQAAADRANSISDDLSTFRPEVERSLSERVRYADVVDGLDSTETDKPLSANQGRVLKEGQSSLESGKQDALTLTIKDNGNIVISNIQGQSKEFMPAAPSGDPMHYAYEAAGAIWNGTGQDITRVGRMTGDTIIHKAGYWYLNELGDISNEEMRAILIQGRNGDAVACQSYLIANGLPLRTNLYPLRNPIQLIDGRPLWSQIEVLVILGNPEAFDYIANCNYDGSSFSIYSRNNVCRKILTIIDSKKMTILKDYSPSKLEFFKLKNMALSQYIISPYFREDCILYMITNEAATSAITITLHADAYARAMANADIVAALQAHPNVSLASA